MPRYTSVQSLSDTNTKVVAGYLDSSSSDGNNAGSGGNGTSGGAAIIEKVVNYTSSIAGANSSEFHAYLGGKKREIERLEAIDKMQKEQEAARLLVEKRELYEKEFEEKTRKNAMKRKKKKDKMQQKKIRKTEGNNIDNNNDNDNNIRDSDEDDSKDAQ